MSSLKTWLEWSAPGLAYSRCEHPHCNDLPELCVLSVSALARAFQGNVPDCAELFYDSFSVNCGRTCLSFGGNCGKGLRDYELLSDLTWVLTAKRTGYQTSLKQSMSRVWEKSIKGLLLAWTGWLSLSYPFDWKYVIHFWGDGREREEKEEENILFNRKILM